LIKNKKSLCFVASVEYSLDAFLYDHIIKLSKFYKITVITNCKTKNFLTGKLNGISVINVNFSRKISVLNDLVCLFRLIIIFSNKKFDVVTSITPKAGLLAIFAAFFNSVPIRVHCFTGQIWSNKLGLKRWFFKQIDKFINTTTTHNIIDGKAQYNFLLNEKVISKNKSFVFGNGSICGVNLEKFRPNKKARSILRKKFNIPNSAFIFLFVGRLNSEKGIYDLLSAFKKANLKSTFLFLIGPDEENIGLKLQQSRNIIIHDYTATPEDFMASCDLLCLPSYREGFGNVVIEAAASGLPSIVSDTYGLSDFVISKKTGFVHKVGDIDEMVRLFKMLYKDKLLVKNIGEKARASVIKDFDLNSISNYWLVFYKNRISKLA
jgi:glycosyltransferase involved in cell wall biosynthesis